MTWCLPSAPRRSWIGLLVCASSLAACSAPIDEDTGSGGGAFATAGQGNAQVVAGITGLYVRKTPSPKSTIVATLNAGAPIQVDCQATGEAVSGNTSWDYLPKYGGYVSDRYVQKLGASFHRCGDDTEDDDDAVDESDPLGPRGPSAASGDVVAEARKWIGTHETATNCNPFSKALGRPCEAWCADFIEYVWQQNGVDVTGITPYAGSLLSYGDTFGTRKSRDSSDVQPGDAVVWARTATDAAHVGIVSEVLANGDVRVINGNYSDAVVETVQARSSTMSGYGIAGFVSPAR